MVSHPLLTEAISITTDLGDGIAFVGAVALLLHLGKTKSRESRDLDFAIAYEISDESLSEKGYVKYPRSGKMECHSPRGFKLDIYSVDLNNVPVKAIVETAKEFPMNRYKVIRAASLEMMIILKYDARREQDTDDLHRIAVYKLREIDWEKLQLLTDKYSKYSFEDIKRGMNEFNTIPLHT